MPKLAESVCHLMLSCLYVFSLYKKFCDLVLGPFCNCYNHWQIWTMHLHQILCEVQQTCYWHFQKNDSSGFWWTLFRSNTGFWMPHVFQGWLSVCLRWWAFGATNHQKKARKCGENLWTHPWRPLPENPSSLSLGWNKFRSLPGYTEHALHCWKFIPWLMTLIQKKWLEVCEMANNPAFIMRSSWAMMFSWPSLQWLCLVPLNDIEAEEGLLWHCRWNPSETADGIGWPSGKWLLLCFWCMEQALR